MIDTNLYNTLFRELAEASNSNNPELVERLNLASIILDNKFVTHSTMRDYLRWAESNGRLSNAMMQIFSRYVFARRADANDVGIYPFLNDLFYNMQEVVNLGDFPELKNPEERIRQVRDGLSELQTSVESYQRRISELENELREQRRLEERLTSLKNEYDAKMREFEDVSNSNTVLRDRLDRFHKEYSEETLVRMKDANATLVAELDVARERFNSDADLNKYFHALSAMVQEHKAIEEIAKYRRTMLELNETTRGDADKQA